MQANWLSGQGLRQQEITLAAATHALERDVFSFNVMEIPQGTGTGFVRDKQGHVVTNFHVIEDADTAHFLTWNVGTEDWDISLLSPSYYRFDDGLHNGHTDLYLPFDLLGVTNPLTNPLALIAFATEQDPATGSGQMNLWGTMPPENPVNSERVVETREPTDGKWGQRYRAWAGGAAQAEPEEVLRFFVEDRREHVARVIRPALEGGAIVVCDRYVASTLAYQAAQGLERHAVKERIQAERFPEPDLVLWLRLPVDQALARLGSNAGERFEHAAFLGRVDAEYARLGLEEIDASASLDVVARAIQDRVRPLLKGR